MDKTIDNLLKKVEKLIYAEKFQESLEIIQNLENKAELCEEEQLSVLILKISSLIFSGYYDEILDITDDYLSKIDFTKNTSFDLKVEQIKIIVLRSDALTRIGRFDEGLKTLKKAEEILKTIPKNSIYYTKGEVEIKTRRGAIHYGQWELNQSRKLLQESLVLNKKTKNLRNAPKIHNLLGLVYACLGELDLAFEQYNECLVISKETDNKIYMRFAYGNTAEIYMFKGELDLAIERYLELIQEFKKRDDKFNLSGVYREIGTVYRLKGDIHSALKHYKESLKIREEMGNKVRISESLSHLIVLTVENNSLKQARKYLHKLQTLSEGESNELIRQRYQFAQALLLGTGKRLVNLVTAQKMLKDIADRETIDNQHTIFTLISLCKFLLEEIKLFDSESAIAELKFYTKKFFEIAQKQNSLVFLTEAHILQSRIALIDRDLTKANELLEQASLIAKKKKLDKISLEIAREKALLLKQMETGKKYQLQKASLKERIKLAQLDDIISRIIYGKTSEITKQKEELSDFAHQMAHDLKRNITNILGFSELIKNRSYNERLMKIILNNAKTMRELLTHSVELADAGLIVQTVDEVDLNHLVESVALIHLQSEITLTHNNLPVLVCDRNKVTQIFKNLFENAIMHGMTTKSISVTRIDEKDGITLSISNDGLPIPKNLNKKLFQRGYTTKKGNTGLGLTIVKKLVEAHGWEITLDSTPITTFRINIPIGLHTERKTGSKVLV